MIVLDEQLKLQSLKPEIRRWYKGSVNNITDITPGMIVKDETIPRLLNGLTSPTFVTINHHDFWGRIPVSRRYCVVCSTLSDLQLDQLSEQLRALLRMSQFRSKASQMGFVIQVTAKIVSYYSKTDPLIRTLAL